MPIEKTVRTHHSSHSFEPEKREHTFEVKVETVDEMRVEGNSFCLIRIPLPLPEEWAAMCEAERLERVRAGHVTAEQWIEVFCQGSKDLREAAAGRPDALGTLRNKYFNKLTATPLSEWSRIQAEYEATLEAIPAAAIPELQAAYQVRNGHETGDGWSLFEDPEHPSTFAKVRSFDGIVREIAEDYARLAKTALRNLKIDTSACDIDMLIEAVKSERPDWPITDNIILRRLGHLFSTEANKRLGEPEQTRTPLENELPRPAISTLLQRDHYPVNSSNTYQALREALASNKFEHTDESPWPTARLDKGDTVGFAQLRPAVADTLLPTEQEAALADLMWKQREQLSDLDTDALDALSAIWLHQASSGSDDAEVEVDDLLRLRGLTPKRGGNGRRGGYEPKQRTEMLAAISRVMNLWLNVAQVEIHEDGRNRKPVTETVQSRPFVMSDRMGQLNLDGGMDVRRFIYRPGRVFCRYLLGPGRMVALLTAKALQYNPYTQQVEKRLAKYLSWQWKIRARRGAYTHPFKARTLLEAACFSFNQRQPSKTYDRLERALDTLSADGVLAGWQFSNWEESEVGQRGWAKKWLDACVLIEPPEIVREHYDNHYRKFDESKKDQPKTLPPAFGERIKTFRKIHGISQMRAAESVGVSQSYLSQLEHGRDVKLSTEVRRKIETWLGQ